MKKNTFYRLFLSISLMCFFFPVKAVNPIDGFRILPLPQKIEIGEKGGLMGDELSHITVKGNFTVPVLGELLDRLPGKNGNGKGITLILTDSDTPVSAEGYVLEVGKKGVTISARAQAGLFYGCQTMEQLMEDSRDFGLLIPFMKITDYPAISYRAVHLDTKHHLDRTEYYYRMIDRLARYKINGIIWELEDKLRYSRRPEIGAPNAISKQEMQAICRYAKERHIDISPLVQGLGHAGFILKHHWELRENPASDWEFCPSDPRTYEVQFDLYRDALEAMPESKYLHVGGDEITAIGIDDRCKATGKSPFELQMVWLKKVCDFAVSHGRTPIFWDDMPLKYADLWGLITNDLSDEEVLKNWNTSRLDEAIKMFPQDCIYMRWQYGDPTGLAHRLLLDWYHKNGLRVMAATAASMGDTPFMPRNNSRAQYIRDFSELVAQNNLEGILSTAWDDGSPHLETVMRGFIAQAEYGWNPGGRTIEEFIDAHACREFGLSGKQMQFLSEMEKAAFFFDGALVTSGHRNPSWGVTTTFKLIDLPDITNPGEWSAKYKKLLDRAQEESVRYGMIVNGLNEARRNALRNRYTLEVYRQTSNLLNYPVRLLEALALYDKAPNTEGRQEALKTIGAVCDSFSVVKKDLENVYSQTRFMQNPDGYISDQNDHNHLAALTNNSDWIFLYEMPMVEKVKKWLDKMEIPVSVNRK